MLVGILTWLRKRENVDAFGNLTRTRTKKVRQDDIDAFDDIYLVQRLGYTSTICISCLNRLWGDGEDCLAGSDCGGTTK